MSKKTPIFKKGSEWRKWDLQVCTNMYNSYVGLGLNQSQLKKMHELTGLDKTVINSDHKGLSHEDFSNIFVEYLVHFTNLDAVAITNHNTGEGIEEIIFYLENKKDFDKKDNPYNRLNIFPGVEIGCNDKCHMLVIFDSLTSVEHKYKHDQDGKVVGLKTWEEFISDFLNEIGITEPRFGKGGNVKNATVGVYNVLELSIDWGFLSVFPHICNADGWWKELQDSTRKRTYLHKDFGIVDVNSVGKNVHLRRILNGEIEDYDHKRVAQIQTSDANSLTTIGSRFTWIKADPTFEGLRQVLFEPELRVYVGTEPEIEKRVRVNQRKYINSVYINHNSGYSGKHGTWFKDEKVPLSKELVAIIGNKGSGKSALTDIIGLLGNSHNKVHIHDGKEELFSFLNKEKFLKNNCANNFHAQLNWYSGNPEKKGLNESTDVSISEKVEYLPQKYLERICANIEHDDFRQKLNKVIFGYVGKEDRHEKYNLDDLIAYLTSQTEKDIEVLIEDLHERNQKIVSIEAKLTSEHRRDIEDKIKSKREEISAHEHIKPKEIKKPGKDKGKSKRIQYKISGIDTSIQKISTNISKLQSELTEAKNVVEEYRQVKQAIQRGEKDLIGIGKKYDSLFKASGFVFTDVVKLEVDFTKVDAILETKRERIKVINESLKDPTTEEGSETLSPEDKEKLFDKSLVYQLEMAQAEKQAIIDALAKPEREYQEYLKKKKVWEDQILALEGDEKKSSEDTLNWFLLEQKNIKETYSNNLTNERQVRVELVKEIYKKKNGSIEFYNRIKSAIDKEIYKYKNELGEYYISIEASLQLDDSMYDKFFDYINQGVKGSFYGTVDGKERLQKITETVESWNEEENVIDGLSKIIENLDEDRRENIPNRDKPKDIFKQMKRDKEPLEFYDYLFGLEYIQTKYDLKVDGKDLSELSPGERGGLLLIFYLMLDRRDIPLVIDQPEDNLDNESVYQILVTFIKRAKKRRQIIMATHNPNLAVVADAEQIICVSIDKKNKANDFSYFAGSIENTEINKKVVNILEGTMPAFDNRRLKYRKQPK